MDVERLIERNERIKNDEELMQLRDEVFVVKDKQVYNHIQLENLRDYLIKYEPDFLISQYLNKLEDPIILKKITDVLSLAYSKSKVCHILNMNYRSVFTKNKKSRDKRKKITENVEQEIVELRKKGFTTEEIQNQLRRNKGIEFSVSSIAQLLRKRGVLKTNYDEYKQIIIDLRKKGYTIMDIAERLNKSTNFVYSRMRKYGIK